MTSEFRNLPGVDRLLSDDRIVAAGAAYPHEIIVGIVRERVDTERQRVSAGKAASSFDEIVNAVVIDIRSMESPGLRRVINASGIIIHTNLGRAPLAAEAITAMDAAGQGFTNLEYDLASGRRGSRHVHVEELLKRLTGAEAALVVNNNAAGILLGLMALARRKEVIVSRGQAVEIGGGFRIPDVMRQSGAKLVEVGTTNRTYAHDFEEAVTARTAALMRVHSSNFKLVGFIAEPSLEDIVEIAHRHSLIVLDDLGSGCFLDTAAWGLEPEPTVQQSVKAGASLIFFSGDKLVGGPQSGIIVGEKQYIDKLKKHPLARALRVDKSRLAGLAMTLQLYLRGEACEKIPVWRMITAPLSEIEQRAQSWLSALDGRGTILDGQTMVGGGSLPGGSLPTRLLAIGGAGKTRAEALARQLRLRNPPLIGRVSEDLFLLDPRTVLPEEDTLVMDILRELSVS